MVARDANCDRLTQKSRISLDLLLANRSLPAGIIAGRI